MNLLFGIAYIISILTVAFGFLLVAVWLFTLIPYQMELKRLNSLLKSSSNEIDRTYLLKDIARLNKKYRITIFKTDHTGYLLLLTILLFIVSLSFLIHVR